MTLYHHENLSLASVVQEFSEHRWDRENVS